VSLYYLTPLRNASVPFTPSSISGLVFYVDPTLGVTKNGSNQVSQWNDQSTSANHLLQATTANKFTYTASQFGSNPGMVAVSSAPSFMTNTSRINLGAAFTAFVVFKPSSQTRQFLLADDVTTLAGLIAIGNTTSIPTEVWDGTNYRDINDSYSTATAYLWQIQSGTGPTTCVVKRNGSTLTLNGTSGSTWAMGHKIVGTRSGGSLPTDGAFGPILIYNRSLTDPECSLVSTWLSGNGWY
jgi:hypothetical protein